MLTRDNVTSLRSLRLYFKWILCLVAASTVSHYEWNWKQNSCILSGNTHRSVA